MIAVWESDISDTFLIPPLNCPIEPTLFKSWGKLFQSMGYSQCKMVSLGQKLKIPERREKRLYNPRLFRVDVCKKPLQKRPNIRKTRAF